MKRHLLASAAIVALTVAGPALAADLPLKAPALKIGLGRRKSVSYRLLQARFFARDPLLVFARNGKQISDRCVFRS